MSKVTIVATVAVVVALVGAYVLLLPSNSNVVIDSVEVYWVVEEFNKRDPLYPGVSEWNTSGIVYKKLEHTCEINLKNVGERGRVYVQVYANYPRTAKKSGVMTVVNTNWWRFTGKWGNDYTIHVYSYQQDRWVLTDQWKLSVRYKDGDPEYKIYRESNI